MDRQDKIMSEVMGNEMRIKFKGFEHVAFFAKNIITPNATNPVRQIGVRYNGYETEWVTPSKIGSLYNRILDMGVNVEFDDFSNYEKMIREVNEEANRHGNTFVMWEHQCTGWHTIKGHRVYLGADSVGMPDGAVSHFDNTSISMNRQIKKAGTLDGWVSAVDKFILGKRINEAVIAASFAGILRGLYPDEAFSKQGLVLNIYGESGNGKTTLVKAAHSIFSLPDTFQNYNGTENAIMQTIAERGEMVSAIDDVCQGGNKNVLDLIFNISSGNGKNRCKSSGSTRQPQQFYGTILTSNITPILHLTGENVGQLRRVIEVGVTETDKIAESGAEADAMTVAFDANYGHAAEKFAKTLLEGISLEKIRELYGSYYSAADGKVANGLQNKLALVLVCAEICNQAFFKEAEQKLDVQCMLEYLVKVCQESAARFIYQATQVEQNGLSERLKTYLANNKHLFHKGRFAESEDRNKWIGMYKTDSLGCITIYIPDTGDCEGTFDAILAGFAPEDILGREQRPTVDASSFEAALHELKYNLHVIQARAKGYKKNIVMEHGGKQEPVYALYFGKTFKF